MKHILDKLDAVTGLSRAAGRFAKALDDSRALVPRPPQSIGAFVDKVKAHAPKDVPDTAGTALGAVAGAIVWKEHRVLGLVAGASVGRNLPALLKPELRRLATVNLGVTGTAVLGSLALKGHPVVGFLGGALIGGGIAYATGWRK